MSLIPRSEGKMEEVAAEAKAVGPATRPCIILDWDDTLCPSSWLAQNGLRLDTPAVVPPSAVKQLRALEESVVNLLRRMIGHGDVTIITNAETGWVELSAKRFLPAVVPMLDEVQVISARSTYEAMHPDSPADWKLQAFYQKIYDTFGSHAPDMYKNIMSFGDSIHERHAVHAVTARLENTDTKSVKFVEHPSVAQLKRQVDLIHSCIDDIATHKGDLDLMLTIQLLYN